MRRRLRRRIHISVHLDRSINASSRNWVPPFGLAVTPLELSKQAVPSRRRRRRRRPIPPDSFAAGRRGTGTGRRRLSSCYPSLPAYPWPGGSYLLARRSSFDFLLCCLFAAYRSAGGWRRGARRGYLLRGARRGTAGRARGFQPASRNAARRVCDCVFPFDCLLFMA